MLKKSIKYPTSIQGVDIPSGGQQNSFPLAGTYDTKQIL
jgi:hypothetical protein